MRKVLKEYNVYKFDELNDDVKERLIDRERECQTESYIDFGLHDDMGSKASDLLNDYFGITSDYLNTYYSLSYLQGDGAMIEFNIDIKDLNNKYKVLSDEELRFIIDNTLVYDIEIRHNGGMYYHEYTFDVNYNSDICICTYDDIKGKYDITEEEFKMLDVKVADLLYGDEKHYNNKSQFIKDIINMNRELEKYGYECMEYFGKCDDDEIIGYIKESDDEYLENGDVWNG